MSGSLSCGRYCSITEARGALDAEDCKSSAAGTIYAPAAQLFKRSNRSLAKSLIADTLKIAGNGVVNGLPQVGTSDSLLLAFTIPDRNAPAGVVASPIRAQSSDRRMTGESIVDRET
jgi:hypothetical protein